MPESADAPLTVFDDPEIVVVPRIPARLPGVVGVTLNPVCVIVIMPRTPNTELVFVAVYVVVMLSSKPMVGFAGSANDLAVAITVEETGAADCPKATCPRLLTLATTAGVLFSHCCKTLVCVPLPMTDSCGVSLVPVIVVAAAARVVNAPDAAVVFPMAAGAAKFTRALASTPLAMDAASRVPPPALF